MSKLSLVGSASSDSVASPRITESQDFLEKSSHSSLLEINSKEHFPQNGEGKSSSDVEQSQSTSPRDNGAQDYPHAVQHPDGGTYYVDSAGRDVVGKAIEESLRKYIPQSARGGAGGYNNQSYQQHSNQQTLAMQPQMNHTHQSQQSPNYFQSQQQKYPPPHSRHYQHQRQHHQYPHKNHNQHQNHPQHNHKQGRGGSRLSSRGAPPVSSYTNSSELMFSSNFPLIYVVNFKRTKDQFIHSISYPLPFQIGDFVKVEADRGHDIGIISEIVLLPPHIKGSMSVAEVEAELQIPIPHRYVFMHASEDEIQFLLEKVRDESRALQVCRELAQQRQMKLNLLDAEFQFDKNKLTFIFTSDRHIDFRELVRDLFAIFKTRIWMHKINPFQASLFMDGFAQSEPFQGAIPTSGYAARGSTESMSQQPMSSSIFPPPIPESQHHHGHHHDQHLDQHHDQHHDQRQFHNNSDANSHDGQQQTQNHLSSQQHEALLKKYLPSKNQPNV